MIYNCYNVFTIHSVRKTRNVSFWILQFSSGIGHYSVTHSETYFEEITFTFKKKYCSKCLMWFYVYKLSLSIRQGSSTDINTLIQNGFNSRTTRVNINFIIKLVRFFTALWKILSTHSLIFHIWGGRLCIGNLCAHNLPEKEYFFLYRTTQYSTATFSHNWVYFSLTSL